MDDVKAPMGKSVSLPANTFERGGYDFLRWRYTYEGETFYFNNMEAVKDLVPTDGAVAMLFAEWTPKLNTVVFENGDSGVISGVANPQQVLTGSKPSMKNLSVEGLPGYVLLGWDYEMRVEGAKALTGHITDPSDLVILGPTTFTAVWSKPIVVSYLPGEHGLFTPYEQGKTTFSNLPVTATPDSYRIALDADMVSIATGNPLGDGDWVFAGWRRAALDKDGKPTGQVFDYLVKDINPGDPFPFPGFRVEECLGHLHRTVDPQHQDHLPARH